MMCEAPSQSRARDMAKKAAKKAGRPPKEERERRDQPRSIVFSLDEVEIVDRAAEHAGVPRAEFMRAAVLKDARRVLGE